MRGAMRLTTLAAVLLVGSAGVALEIELDGLSNRAIAGLRLSKMMPGHRVVQGSHNQEMWWHLEANGENDLDPPANSPLGWGAHSVGTRRDNLVVGGVQYNVRDDLGSLPIWYRSNNQWVQAAEQSVPFPCPESRRVQDIAYGDPQGTKLYAFGWETFPKPQAAVWESNDRGQRWDRILRQALAGHQWAWGDCANADGVVYGHTDRALIRLSPEGHVTWLDYPSAHRGIASLSAPNRFEVTLVVVEPAPAKAPSGIFDAPAVPTVHVHYSNDSAISWTELGTLPGAPNAAEFLGKYIGVVAFPTEKPLPGTRLLYTRDGCKSWKEDYLPGAQVEGIRIVNNGEVYLLLQSLMTQRPFYAKWNPTW